jgi:hypothetical protein
MSGHERYHHEDRRPDCSRTLLKTIPQSELRIIPIDSLNILFPNLAIALRAFSNKEARSRQLIRNRSEQCQASGDGGRRLPP